MQEPPAVLMCRWNEGRGGHLQQAEQAVDGVVDGQHAPKVGEAEERAEDGVVAGVQEEAPRAPNYQRHDLRACMRKPD